MNSFDHTLENFEMSINGRRKKKNKANHGREVEKRARNSCGGKIPSIARVHHAADGFCCSEFLTQADLMLNQEKCYLNMSKVDQDAFLLRLIRVQDPKLKRVRVHLGERKKTEKHDVHLPSPNPPGTRTDQSMQSDILLCFRHQLRVTRVAKYYSVHKESRSENRGGRRNPDNDTSKTNAIIDHIRSFQCKPNHDSRSSAPGRRYLPCELNVARMYRLFLAQDMNVSYSLYFSVFGSSFNLGFGHPASDACGTCLQFRSQVKDNSKSDEQRKVLAAQFILHCRKARMFYNLMNSVNDTITLCFDVMENLVLPRTPVGQAYCSRQLYLYVFGMVIHRADGSQRKEDIHLYTWQENENRKDSNMISSAVKSFLTSILPRHLNGRTDLRLFSDSCFGQNENINIISMLLAWRNQHPNFKSPTRSPSWGHSFIPADRVFGRIEQDIRTHNTILLPGDYLPILSRHGNVQRYAVDWHAFNFKKETALFTK